MELNYNNRAKGYIVKWLIIVAGTATKGLWSSYYVELINRHNISTFFGYTLPLIIVTAVIFGIDIYRVFRGMYITLTTKFKITDLFKTIHESTTYNGSPIFYVDNIDQSAFQVCYNSVRSRILFGLRRFMFNEFPVIYYNVTAKSFLNWIDYLYLKTLCDLRKRNSAKIIVGLHFDEEIYREGFFTEAVKEKYDKLFKQSENIIKSIIGRNVEVIDERWFLERGSKRSIRFIDYFFGIMIAKINDLAKKLFKQEITFDEYYRCETNLISILPAILIAKKYNHLFVLDYEGSFKIWEQPPFSELKRNYRIFFFKCKKISGPHGERIPSWSEQDGINITDDTDTIQTKLNALDDTTANAMMDIFNIGEDSVKIGRGRKRLFEKIKQIKSEVKL